MPFQVSPGVNVSEIDLTASAPAVSTSDGAMVGQFSWGPSGEITNISSETDLVSVFGKPNNANYKSWFTAANYLSYANSLKVVRVLGNNALNSVSGTKQVNSALDAEQDEVGVGPLSAMNFTGDAQVVQTENGDGSATTFTITNPADMTDRTATVTVDGTAKTDGVHFVRTGNSIDFSAGTAPHGAPTADTGNVVITIAARTQFTLSRDTHGETPTVTVAGAAETGFTASGAVVTFNSAPADGAAVAISVPSRSKFTVTETIEATDSLTVLLNGTTLTEGVEYSVSGQLVTFVSAPADAATIKLKVFSAPVTSFNYGTLASPIGNESDLGTFGATHSAAGIFAARCAGVRGDSLKVYMADANTFTGWPAAYQALFDDAPDASELHIVVTEIDDRDFVTERVVETHAFLSKSSNGKRDDGTLVYYAEVINETSSFLWALNHHPDGTDWGQETTAAKTTFANLTEAYIAPLSSGSDGITPTVNQVQLGFDHFVDPELTDVSLLMMGEWGELSGNASDRSAMITKLIGMAESRKDCVALLSAAWSAVSAKSASQVISSFNDATSNYAFADSNWKYQYDKYNDIYRWVPLNGDIAGLMARTDSERDAWFSPAGFNRGVIKNVVKLAWPQNKTDRDQLYKKAINPVVTFPGQGSVLFGDKTLTLKPSAFDRINVRRLFIVLEKSIAAASKFTLFEFNDEFTRSQFVSLVEPFLRDVKGRRGIFDFQVVCDETNNTSGVIDRNEFIGDIFIKPARSINFIQLNFVAVRSGVSFEEIVGAV